MQVNTKWFGTIDISEDKVLTFDKGLIGLDEYKKFTIVYNDEKSDSKSIMWLQSLDNQELALPIMDPTLIVETYDPVVEDELLSSIGDVSTAEPLILVTLTVPADITKMTSNFKAPIIINVDTLKACQVIVENEEYKVKFPIYEILKNKAEKGGE